MARLFRWPPDELVGCQVSCTDHVLKARSAHSTKLRNHSRPRHRSTDRPHWSLGKHQCIRTSYSTFLTQAQPTNQNPQPTDPQTQGAKKQYVDHLETRTQPLGHFGDPLAAFL